MSLGGFEPFRQKMKECQVDELVIRSFERNFQELFRQHTGTIAESEISPAQNVLNLEDLKLQDCSIDDNHLSQVVVIKLNGGLGTSMGLQKAKSLLPIKKDINFLDVMFEQMKSLPRVQFLLMNSIRTSQDTLTHCEKYGYSSKMEIPQSSVPKIGLKNLSPATHELDKTLEWCPPGHGDIYTSLYTSGKLDQLLKSGVKYAFISNSDNLSATLDPHILEYFIKSDQSFLMEVTHRTPADRKGGHLAIRRSDGQPVLREVAQCPQDDMDTFQDINIHQYFNTNNLWIQLDTLRELLEKNKGILPLPVIQNIKTLDPRDKSTSRVYQLETAMGAAIECFPHSGAICVPRSRFAPVKTTSDLMLIRSDVYDLRPGGDLSLVPERKGIPPIITLSADYKMMDSLDALWIPSLRGAKSLDIQWPVSLEKGVVIKWKVSFINKTKNTQTVSPGVYEDMEINF